ncbi:MAG: hypothetical protein R3245_01800, partial [Kiloniellales bacterium]|nr:hypothetical protein [Kiloniellales bacterium]
MTGIGSIGLLIQAIGLFYLCSACTSTSYQSYDAEPQLPDLLDRRVTYEVTGTFYRTLPSCFLILPAKGSEDEQLSMLIEDSLERYMGQKTARVIGPLVRDRRAGDLALDLDAVGDR